jgi:hypothetical protein
MLTHPTIDRRPWLGWLLAVCYVYVLMRWRQP